MKRRGRRPRTESGNTDNLFAIEDGYIFMGNRANNTHVDLFAEQLIKLPVDKSKSIFIPLSVADNRNAASNFVLAAKRRACRVHKNAFYSTKYLVSTDKKSYLGARIWRLA